MSAVDTKPVTTEGGRPEEARWAARVPGLKKTLNLARRALQAELQEESTRARAEALGLKRRTWWA